LFLLYRAEYIFLLEREPKKEKYCKILLSLTFNAKFKR